MLVQKSGCSLALDGWNGRIISFKTPTGRELICGESARPLLELRLRDGDGNPVTLDSNSAKAVFSEEGDVLQIAYSGLGGLAVSARVKLRWPEGERLLRWSVEIDNGASHAIEWVALPVAVVPNDLIATGGDARILYPICEGVLVEDANLRGRMGYRYHQAEYPTRGLEGLYPGSVGSQFMAYYGKSGGLYVAAHDPAFSTKSIEYRNEGSGIELEFKLFTGGDFGQGFKLPYEMVLGVFEGDWHDAADIYRNWLDSQGLPAAGGLEEEPLPAWLSEPLTVVTYPIRGTHDMDLMEPNEFYPYTAALKHVERIAEETQSHILVILMHWESTAPWAPPYVWPPFGDQADFKRFVEELHKRGHRIGLYASGIGWTLKSKVYDYGRTELPGGARFEEAMCIAPDGTLPLSKICHGHRDGYDLCPAAPLAGEIALGEILKMSDAGVDYAQYFDQNMGGGACLCYAKGHGHPPMPGAWLTASTSSLMRGICEELRRRGSKMIVGCETAAAEPFIPFMRFNDLRYNVDMLMGKPVPLYAYLYHESIFNFMGNQVCSGQFIDREKTPDSLLFRIAYSFAAGDVPTLVLKGGGDAHWAWGEKWDVPAPEQAPVFALLRKVFEALRGPAGEFLRKGRMLKPFEAICASMADITLRHGDKLSYPSVLSTRWRLKSGEEAQVFINHTKSPQAVSVSLPDGSNVEFELPALAVRLIELDGKEPDAWPR